MKTYKCPLCGHVFEKEDLSVCKSCPFGRGCNMVRCSNCGYEFIPEVDER